MMADAPSAPGPKDKQSPFRPITVRDVLTAVFFPSEPSSEVPPRFPLSSTTNQDADITGEPEGSHANLVSLGRDTHIEYPADQLPALDDVTLQRSAVLVGGSCLAIALGILGQLSIEASGQIEPLSVLLYGGSILTWIGLVFTEFALPNGGVIAHGPTTDGPGSGRTVVEPDENELFVRLLLGTSVVLLCAATFLLMPNNMFTFPGVIAWISSIVLAMVALTERPILQLVDDVSRFLRFDFLRLFRKPRLTGLQIAAVVAIFAVAVFFRLWQLDMVPPEMTSDHVEKLLDVHNITTNEIYNVFMRSNGGRESLHFYFLAVLQQLTQTGISFQTLKIGSALEALLLVPIIVLLAREVTDTETGLIAAGLLAISWWHTAIGRLGLRIALTPLIMAVLLITLIRGMRTGSRRAWIWAGIWMGVGVFSYQAMRLAPLVAVAAWALCVASATTNAVSARDTRDALYHQMSASNTLLRQSANLASSGLIAIVVFIPMLRVWVEFPDDLWNRVVGRTTASEVTIEASPATVFINNYWNAVGQYNIAGDSAWFHAPERAAHLDAISAVLLVLGGATWLVRVRVRGDPVDLFIVVSILIMLLPSALSIAFPNENPSATRSSGTLPMVLLLAAWPLALVRQRWHQMLSGVDGSILATALVILLLTAASALNYRTYFIDYYTSYRLAAPNSAEIVEAIKAEAGADISSSHVWIQAWPYWQDHRAIGLNLGNPDYHNVLSGPERIADDVKQFGTLMEVRPLVFILHPTDQLSLSGLKQAFPHGRASVINSTTEGKDFLLFIVSEDDKGL